LAQPDGRLGRAAKEHDASVVQLSLAWLLHHSPVLIPIPGTSSVKHLEENMAATKVQLSDAEWKAIEEAA
jgi:aryl-alcohol dehydrogenase-like predicted oxidoreductase